MTLYGGGWLLSSLDEKSIIKKYRSFSADSIVRRNCVLVIGEYFVHFVNTHVIFDHHTAQWSELDIFFWS